MCGGIGIDQGQAWPKHPSFRRSPGVCGSDQTHGFLNRAKSYPMLTFGRVRMGVCCGFCPAGSNRFESPSLSDSEKLN